MKRQLAVIFSIAFLAGTLSVSISNPALAKQTTKSKQKSATQPKPPQSQPQSQTPLRCPNPDKAC